MSSNTRERLTEAAVRRFYRDGFRNVGIDQILADVGISKTAFYKHFDCKDDLVLAALEQKDRWLQDTFRQMIRDRGGPTPAGQLRAIFGVVEEILNSEDFQGCIFVNVAIEFPLPHEPAHRAAAQHKRAMETIIEELAVQAGAAEPRAMAQELCLVMEGAYVTQHVSGNRQTIEIARRLAQRVLMDYLGPDNCSAASDNAMHRPESGQNR